MNGLKLILLPLLCAVQAFAHPGHSPLDGDAAHQLTNADHWLPGVVLVTAFVVSITRYARKKKL